MAGSPGRLCPHMAGSPGRLWAGSPPWLVAQAACAPMAQSKCELPQTERELLQLNVNHLKLNVNRPSQMLFTPTLVHGASIPAETTIWHEIGMQGRNLETFISVSA